MSDYYSIWARDSLNVTFGSPIEVRDLPGDERGVYCTSPIKENSNVLAIPFTSLMTTLSAVGTPLESVRSSWQEDDVLALLLLYEKFHKGTSSKWHTHIERLPIQYHSIINFSSEELEWIRGCNLAVTAAAWQQQVKADFDALLPKAEKVFNLVPVWLTLENYLWALCTIWSRFVTVTVPVTEDVGATTGSSMGEEQQYRSMVSFFDMLNHSPTAAVGHRYDPTTCSLQLVAAQGFEAGAEVVLNYGALGNGRLLMLYGFCIPPCAINTTNSTVGGPTAVITGNPHNIVDLYAPLPPDIPHYAEKRLLLQEWGIWPGEEGKFELHMWNTNNNSQWQHARPIPEALVVCLRLQFAETALSDEDSDSDSDSDFEADVTADTRDFRRRSSLYQRARYAPLAREMEKGISDALLAALAGMLAGYSETVAQDEELLDGWGLLRPPNTNKVTEITEGTVSAVLLPPSERFKNAVLLRYSEKVVLQAAMRWIEIHVDNLTPM